MTDAIAAKPQILCVDDEPRVLDGLKLTLRRDFDVLTECAPQAALELLDRSPAVVAVISDMRMPGMDGATFLAHVARRRPAVARILLTGDTGSGQGADMAASSPLCVLKKPCTPARLIATLRELVRMPTQGSAS